LQGELRTGDGLMILAVLAYALYGVLLRHWQLPLSVSGSLFAQTSLALCMHIPLLLVFGLQPISLHNLLPVLYAALLPAIVAPFMWMKAIQTLGPNRASMFTNLGPVLTAVIAYFYLQEQWTVYHTVGGMLALSGVMLAQLRQKTA
jgi:drug/metabolite transporter (DMT)-like permease